MPTDESQSESERGCARDNYIQSLIQAELPNASIICSLEQYGDGKGIYAKKTYVPTDIIWKELPYVAMQFQRNKQLIQCCAHCFVPIIDPQTEWNRLCQVAECLMDPKDDKVNKIASYQDVLDTIEMLKRHRTSGVPQESPVQSENNDFGSYFAASEYALRCPGCENVTYCSAKCKDDAKMDSHGLLCSYGMSKDSAMARFIAFSRQTNELFILAAKVLSKIVISFVKTRNMPMSRKIMDQFNDLLWWDAMFLDAEDNNEIGTNIEEEKAALQALLFRAFEYFMDGLLENLPRFLNALEENEINIQCVLESCRECLNIEFFAQVMGAFVMHTIRMEIDHPFQSLSIALMQMDGSKVADTIQLPKCVDHVKETLAIAFSEEADLDELILERPGIQSMAGIEGTALLPITSTLNHSCVPNCTVIFTNNRQANVYVLKSIQNGDELCIEPTV